MTHIPVTALPSANDALYESVQTTLLKDPDFRFQLIVDITGQRVITPLAEGLANFHNRIVKQYNETTLSQPQHCVRILRALQWWLLYGANIEYSTWKAMEQLAPLMDFSRPAMQRRLWVLLWENPLATLYALHNLGATRNAPVRPVNPELARIFMMHLQMPYHSPNRQECAKELLEQLTAGARIDDILVPLMRSVLPPPPAFVLPTPVGPNPGLFSQVTSPDGGQKAEKKCDTPPLADARGTLASPGQD